MKENITINAVANGYIVTETSTREFVSCSPSHVFESFESLTAWLKTNIPQHPKPATP